MEILWLLMRTFTRSGLSLHDIAQQLITFGGQIRQSRLRDRQRSTAGRDDWVQIMTLWSMDPAYVDDDGRPVPLRLRGAAPSIEALLRRVRSTLTIERVCEQLIATGAAKKIKGRLVAIAHAPIVFPKGSEEQSAHHLDLLHWVLLNIEHNAIAPNGALWVERQSICQNFPESALSAYSAATSERVQAFLAKEDANMHRIASFTSTKGRKVRATVQVLFSARGAQGGVPVLDGGQAADRTRAARIVRKRNPRGRRAPERVHS